MALTKINSEGIKDGEVKNADMADDAVGVAELSATGTASSSTFLRGDNSWATPTDTNTQVGGATGVDFNDDVKARFGTDNDLEISHNDTNGWIDNNKGALYIDTTTDIVARVNNNEDAIKAIANGAVELYHNNVKVFDTDANGITVVGPEGGEGLIKLYADEGDDNADKWQLLSNTNGSWYLQDYSAGSWQTNIKSTGGGAVELYYDKTKRFETASAGVIVTGSSVNHGLRINTSMTSYGVINVRDPNDANIACLQAENGTQGSNQVNLVIRSVDLGSTSWAGARYNAEYHQFNHQATSKVRIDSDGLKFGSDTAGANALSDYEEGSWTPSMSANVASSTGIYTKVGRVVHIGFTLSVSSNSTNQEMVITGLPFTALNNSGNLTGSLSATNYGSPFLFFTNNSADGIHLRNYSNVSPMMSDFSGKWLYGTATYMT